MWESNPWLSVHEADTLPPELTRFFISPSSIEQGGTSTLFNFIALLAL